MAQEINLNIFEKPMDILVTQAGFFGISKKEAIPYAEELLKKVDLYEKRNTQVRFFIWWHEKTINGCSSSYT